MYWGPTRTDSRLVVPLILLILFSGFDASAQLQPAPEIIAWDTSAIWSPLWFTEGGNRDFIIGYESVQMKYFWAEIDDSLRLIDQVLLPLGVYPRTGTIQDNQMTFSQASRIDSSSLSFSTEVWDIRGRKLRADTSSYKYSHLFQRDFLQSLDGGYLISGIGRELDSFKMTPVLAKFNAQGTFEWESKVYNNQSWSPLIIHQMEDGMIFLLGHDPSDSIGKVFLTMFNPQGDSVNTKYIYPDHGRAMDLVGSYDKGMFLVGTFHDSLARNHVFIQKIDSACDAVWRKYHLILEGDSVRHIPKFKECISTWDGGVVVSLDIYIVIDSSTVEVPYLLKLDKFGDPQWEKVLHPPIPGQFGVHRIRQTKSGAFLLIGYTRSPWPQLEIKGYVGLLGADGSFPLVVSSESSLSLIVYPNPAVGWVILSWSQSSSDQAMLRMVDVHGKEYFRQTQYRSQGQHDLTIPVSDAASGIYFIELTTSQGTTSRTFIKH